LSAAHVWTKRHGAASNACARKAGLFELDALQVLIVALHVRVTIGGRGKWAATFFLQPALQNPIFDISLLAIGTVQFTSYLICRFRDIKLEY